MKIIKFNKAKQGTNIENCKTMEYSFEDKDLDLGVAVITGRYPESGYCVNLISKELVYVLEGSGILYYGNGNKVEFAEGDAILIDNNEKYYWDTKYCKVAMACTPAFTKDQYKVVK